MGRKISDSLGRRAIAAWLACGADRDAKACAVRYSLQVLAELHPGQAVEVRVPPFGAVQIGAGTVHRRGTPPAVVEMDTDTWLALACGNISWKQVVVDGQINATGVGSDLSAYLPVFSAPSALSEPVSAPSKRCH